MSTPTWDEIGALFEAALDVPGDARASFVVERAGAQSALASEVLEMLAAHEGSAALDVERRLLAVSDVGSADLRSGSQVGSWTIDDLVGRGGMGEVYRARRTSGGFSQVGALKIMRRDGGSRDALRRFHDERIALARLTHPNISPIVDGGTTEDGRPFLVMPYLERSLPVTQYCEHRELNLDARLQLFLTIADAVHHAHIRLIVHRDLKPSNILVTDDGRPMLLDFGIAKLLDDSSDGATRTQARLLTPQHAAPEQVRGEPVSTATDVHGLGVLLYELVAGVHPFHAHATSARQLEQAILDVVPRLPSEVTRYAAERARVRGDLDHVILMALRKEPERRYASAAQFADDVRQWLAQLPVRAQRDTLAYRMRRFVSRNRGLVAAGSVAAVLVLGTAATAVREALARRAERDHALREAANAEEMVGLLTSLFEQSDPRVLPGGDTMRVAAYLDRAETQLSALASQPARQLRLARILSQVRLSRGEYARAESLLRAAVAGTTDSLGAQHEEILRARFALSRTMGQGRDARQALVLLDSVRRAWAAMPSPPPADVAATLLEMASLTRDPDQARALLDTVVLLRSKGGATADSIAVATFLDAEATALRLRGRYLEARPLYATAIAILDRKLPRDHVTRLSVLGNLAVCELDLANWTASDSLVGEIVRQVRRDSTGIEGVARSLELSAVIHANQGRFVVALAEEQEAISWLSRRLPAGHELLDNSRRNLAIMTSASGRVVGGLALLDTVIASRRAANDSASVAYMSAQRVPMLLRLGRTSEALRAVDALRLMLPAVPANSRWHADAALYQGMALFAGGRVSEAVPMLLAARQRYDVSYDSAHPRRALARCALGAALVADGRPADGLPLVHSACDAHARWGLADPSVVRWGQVARRQ